MESEILKWAKTVSIFNNFYISNKRCGCMYCPMSARITYAYLYKYYPDNFKFMIEKMRETELIREIELKRKFSITCSNPKYDATYLEKNIKEKWLLKLNEIEDCYYKNKIDV